MLFQAGVVDAVSEIANAQCADKDQPNIRFCMQLPRLLQVFLFMVAL